MSRFNASKDLNKLKFFMDRRAAIDFRWRTV